MLFYVFFFFNDTASTEIYTLSLHDALPILFLLRLRMLAQRPGGPGWTLESPSRIELGALVLATLVLIVPKLPRPTRRAIAVLPPVRIVPPEWRAWLPLAPPRPSLLPSA